MKAAQAGYERSLALFFTPAEHGGCRGCRFFFACKGQCPGTAIDGDWRNRSEHCPVWLAVFEELEEELIQAGHAPLSRSPALVEVHARLVEAWRRGENRSIRSTLPPAPAVAPAAPEAPAGWRSLLEAARAALEAA